MKKHFAFIFSIYCFCTTANARYDWPTNRLPLIDTTPKLVAIPNTQQVMGNIVLAPDIIVYENPNYSGRSSKFIRNVKGVFEFPFLLMHVSFKVPEGKVVYIKKCSQEFATEDAYFMSQPNINLAGICGVRTDMATTVRVTFGGISTEVHNHDCLRFAGRIDIQMIETSPGASPVTSLMPFRYRTFPGALNAFTYTPFNWNASQLKDQLYDPYYNNTGTIYNNNPIPVLDKPTNRMGHVQTSSYNEFYVGRSALREGRVSLVVSTSLTSSHKTCDLCDDFSSGIKMLSPGHEIIPLNKTYGGGKILDASHPLLVLGPYMAKGSRDGTAITATAGTIKNFRVHLKVDGF
jgi:hypothetical protein